NQLAEAGRTPRPTRAQAAALVLIPHWSSTGPRPHGHASTEGASFDRHDDFGSGSRLDCRGDAPREVVGIDALSLSVMSVAVLQSSIAPLRPSSSVPRVRFDPPT